MIPELPQLPVYALNAPAGLSPKGIVVLDGQNKMAKHLTKHPLFKAKTPKTRSRSHPKGKVKRPKRYF